MCARYTYKHTLIVCMYVYIYICIYTYIQTYTHTHTLTDICINHKLRKSLSPGSERHLRWSVFHPDKVFSTCSQVENGTSINRFTLHKGSKLSPVLLISRTLHRRAGFCLSYVKNCDTIMYIYIYIDTH